MSFGAAEENLVSQSADEPFRDDKDQLESSEARASCISIRDIHEVRDKVPASPATKVEPIEPYFK